METCGTFENILKTEGYIMYEYDLSENFLTVWRLY